MSGQLVFFQRSDNGLLIQVLSADRIGRDEALYIAKHTQHENCYGYRQAIFIHQDGFLELWDKELRE